MASVKQDGHPNFLGSQYCVPTSLNVNAWEKHLQGYWDHQIIHFLRYGFPLDVDKNISLAHQVGNHPSANQYRDHVESYIKEEQSFGAIIGPFDNPPYDSFHCSPFLTREKVDSNKG